MATVLIIEDDSVMQRMYKRVFEYEGFEVVQELDGQAGVAKAKELVPDVILLDIMMPQLSGLQALDILKADQATASIPVMVFTNLAGKQDADAVLEKGAIACVHKSEVNPKQVAQMVKDELMKRGVQVQPQGGQQRGGGQPVSQEQPQNQQPQQPQQPQPSEHALEMARQSQSQAPPQEGNQSQSGEQDQV